MAEDGSIEHISQRIRALGRTDVAEVGQLPPGVLLQWPGLQSTTMIVTGPQWEHILARHPELDSLLAEFIGAVREPDEIYTDREHADGVTFWKRLDEGGRHWLRVTVSLATSEKAPGIHNSVITARKNRRRGYLREILDEKKVWPEEGA